MGASWFQESGNGPSLRQTYDRLVEIAEDEYGHQDGYNGTISTTTVFGVKDLTSEFKRSGKSLQDFIDGQVNILAKRQCAAVCIQEPKANTNKTKSQVEHIVTPGTKKWVLKYVVYNHNGNSLGSFDTKGAAVEHARKRTEKTGETTTIDMEKVLDKVNPRVAKITYKRASTERDGKWIFFGWAAE